MSGAAGPPVQPFLAEVMADGPLAYYRFAEPAGAATAADASGNGRHGSASGAGLTFGVAGMGAGDTAARFEASGAPRVTVGDRDGLNPRLVTMEALVRWSGPTGDIQQRILEKSTSAAGVMATYGLSVLPSGRVRVELSTHTAQPFVTSAAALKPNAPAHVAATYDGTAIAIYLDGELDTTTAATGELRSSTGLTNLGLGNQAEPSRARAFNGIIDEIALYDRALPTDRIAAHAGTLAGWLGNLVRNPDFAIARLAPPPALVGAGTSGRAAADEWELWNDPAAHTTSELLPSTRVSGDRMLHVATTAAHCGLVQAWDPHDLGPAAVTTDAWLRVVHGAVMLRAGNTAGAAAATTGRWERVEATGGRTLVNEVIVCATSEGGADFYVGTVAVREGIHDGHP